MCIRVRKIANNMGTKLLIFLKTIDNFTMQDSFFIYSFISYLNTSDKSKNPPSPCRFHLFDLKERKARHCNSHIGNN